jgi:hypothetical protein
VTAFAVLHSSQTDKLSNLSSSQSHAKLSTSFHFVHTQIGNRIMAFKSFQYAPCALHRLVDMCLLYLQNGRTETILLKKQISEKEEISLSHLSITRLAPKKKIVKRCACARNGIKKVVRRLKCLRICIAFRESRISICGFGFRIEKFSKNLLNAPITLRKIFVSLQRIKIVKNVIRLPQKEYVSCKQTIRLDMFGVFTNVFSVCGKMKSVCDKRIEKNVFSVSDKLKYFR